MFNYLKINLIYQIIIIFRNLNQIPHQYITIDSLAKKGARILQIHSNDLSYHSVKLYIRRFFNNLQKEDIEQKIKDKHWKNEIF